jgi:microcystin-dependent protein
MPRNSQGLYTLPAGNPVVPNTLIEANWANPTMDDIAAALTGSLPRDGSAPMTGPLTLSADAPTAPRNAVSKGYVDQFLALATGMPAGAVTAYAGASVPPGYLECNGQAVSRATYPDLFTVIGTIYGAGDASTTFNVPDMRDEFIRGKSAARAVGSKQAASFASHTHTMSDPGHGHTQAEHAHVVYTDGHTHGINDPGHSHAQSGSDTAGVGYAYGTGSVPNSNTGTSVTGISVQSAGSLAGGTDWVRPTISNSATGIVIGGTGGTETVPQNIAQIYIIKAVNDSTSGGGGGGTGTLTGVTSSDPNMIAIDNTNPAVPLLDIQANVAFGIPQLDVNGQVPLAQMPTPSSPTGFRNILINGDMRINQRGVTIAAAANGAYGPDRWKKVDASNMTQIIESGNFKVSTTYTLSGTNVTTQQLTSPASGDWNIGNIPITATNVQLEEGSVATPFELRPVGMELSLCQRYYQVPLAGAYGFLRGYHVAAATILNTTMLPVTMRATPTVAQSGSTSLTNVSGSPLIFARGNSISIAVQTTATGDTIFAGTADYKATLSAEL